MVDVQICTLHGVKRDEFSGCLVLPVPTDYQKVQAAWSYAIRYSAKGFDLPDYEAAVMLMLQRHPKWNFYPTRITDIHYQSHLADNDQPE